MSSVAFVFGSRSVVDSVLVNASLDRLLLIQGVDQVWSGGARGADSLAAEWARSHGFGVDEWLPERPDVRADYIRRSQQLVCRLPAGSPCVCFAPAGVFWPGSVEAVAEAGGVRAFLSAGSRASVGFCLARGLSVLVVWACGRVSRLVPPKKEGGGGGSAAATADHPSGDYVMPLGKHKGTTLKNVPLSYLEWLIDQDWPSTPLLYAVAVHLQHRVGEDAPPPESWRVREEVEGELRGEAELDEKIERNRRLLHHIKHIIDSVRGVGPIMDRKIDFAPEHGSDPAHYHDGEDFYPRCRSRQDIVVGDKHAATVGDVERGANAPNVKRREGDLGEDGRGTAELFGDPEHPCTICGTRARVMGEYCKSCYKHAEALGLVEA